MLCAHRPVPWRTFGHDIPPPVFFHQHLVEAPPLQTERSGEAGKMKTAGLLAAALVAATASTAPQQAAAQHARDGGLMAALHREIARSSQFLEQMWDIAFGQEEAGESERVDGAVRVVVVVEDPQTPAETLTAEDRTLACRAAVQLVEEQTVLKLEAARLATRLRVPQSGGVSVQLVDATTCAELKRRALVAECQRVSETMDEQIVAFLRHGTSHQEICETLVSAQNPPLSCKLCKRFVQMVDDAVTQDMAHVQQVREILGDICDSMAADSMCHTFLKHYDDVVDWLKRGTDPEVVCERITMCTAPTQGESTTALASVEDVSAICDVHHGCFYCVQISSVVGFVAKNAPGQLDSLHTILKYVCKLTPKSCKCDEAEKNFDKIVELTHQGKRPKEICVAIGLCKKESEKSKLLELVAKPEMAETMSALVLATPPADDKTCFYCDYFVTLLEVAMQEDGTSLDTIRDYADMVCGMLGEDSVCHQYVDKLDYAIDALKKDKKPHEVCTQLKFCSAKKEVADVLAKKAAETVHVAAPALALADDKKCFYCDYFTTLLEVAIQENPDAVEEVRQYADMICGMLGDDNLCHQYVDKFDFVVKAINQGKKPREICFELKFCTKKAAAPASKALVPRDDKKCFYCDYFVTLIQVALQEDDDDIEAIKLYADIVCGMLGDQSTCHQYVDKLDYVVDSLNKGKKPRKICTELKFCTAKSLPALPEGVDMAPQLADAISKSTGVAPNLKFIDGCFFCTQIANLFKVAIAQDPEQVSEIRLVADLICNVLSADNKCHDVMRKIDRIIDSIEKGMEPGAICRDMQFCPKATMRLPLPKKSSTGGNNCAYCDGLATVLEYALKSKPEQVEQIREAAGIVCGFMPADDKCHNDLKMFDEAVNDLRSGKSPHEVCKELNFCDSSSISESKMMPLSAAKLDRIDAMAKTKGTEAPKSMSVGCLLCEYTAEVLTRVQGSETETRLARKTLQTMCVVLPPSAKCDVISSKFDDLIQLVGKGKSPSQACHALSMCDAAFVNPTPIKEIAEVMAVKN